MRKKSSAAPSADEPIVERPANVPQPSQTNPVADAATDAFHRGRDGNHPRAVQAQREFLAFAAADADADADVTQPTVTPVTLPGSAQPRVRVFASQQEMRAGPRAYTPAQQAVIDRTVAQRQPLPSLALPLDDD